MLARYVYPTRLTIAVWMMPILTGIVFYILATISVSAGTPPRPQVQVLPIDWLTLGCGGALMGSWLSDRMRETRVLETLDAARNEA
jgi:hypothetical protein